MNIPSILKQPYPLDSSVKRKLGMAVFFGLFVFVFLLLFKPFELDRFAFPNLVMISFIYGAITWLCVFSVTAGLPLLMPGMFRESNWTTGKHILFIVTVVFFVGLANYIVSPLLVGSSLNWYNVLRFQVISVLTGLLPIAIFSLIKQNQLLKRFGGEAEAIDEKLKEKKQEVEEVTPIIPSKISFSGDYQDEKIDLYADDLYVITSANNYIKLYYLVKEKLHYTIIRSTLKKAEAQLQPYPNFFKCHRAFIINLDKVENVEGNAQGYKVRINLFDELIPVSRNLNGEFSDKLLSFNIRK